jgi:hypothetical protein
MAITDYPWRETGNRRIVQLGRHLLWPSHQHGDRLFVDRREQGFIYLSVPDWFTKSWLAGEPLNGLVDWLIENYGCEHPWLEEAVRS